MNRLILACLIYFFTANCLSAEEENAEPKQICSPTECYSIVKVLGEGAFGKVYAVKDSQGQPFAVKSYKYQNLEFFDLYNDAEREFLRGQAFNHPHIIKSYDLFAYNSSTPNYLVLQYVDGKTLYTVDKGEISTEEAMAAAQQFTDAMRHALALDYMHLDLHQGNLMLDSEARMMIIDLASFFSREEIYHFAQTFSERYSTSEKNVCSLQVPSRHFQATQLKAKTDLEPLKAKKLERFFKENPRLLKQLKQKKPRIKKAVALKTAKFRRQSDSESTSSETESGSHAFLNSFYFDQISDMCINILSKSNLPREQKIHLRSEIKKLAWNYLEDAEEGKNVPVDKYLNQLTEVLHY